MRISRRQFAYGIAGAAALGCPTALPSGVVERRIYARGSALPSPEILRRNGIRVRSIARTEDGTVYLIAFDTLEARIKAWDRFNADEAWCAIRDEGRVALQEIRVHAAA
jgi:hypothetical protein